MEPAPSINPTSELTTAENVSDVVQSESAAPVTLAGVSEPTQSTDADEKQKIGPLAWETIFSRSNVPFGASVLEAHAIDGIGCLVRSRTLAGNAISEALVLVPGVECKPRSNDPKDGHELLPIGFKP